MSKKKITCVFYIRDTGICPMVSWKLFNPVLKVDAKITVFRFIFILITNTFNCHSSDSKNIFEQVNAQLT